MEGVQSVFTCVEDSEHVVYVVSYICMAVSRGLGQPLHLHQAKQYQAPSPFLYVMISS